MAGTVLRRGALRGATLACVLVAASLLSSCRHNPQSDRFQLDFIPDSFVESAAESTFRSLARSGTLVREEALDLKLRAMVRRLARAADLSIPEWKIAVIRNPIPNAMVMPGGLLVIHSGILTLAKSDAELATVIGHEVAHLSARHTAEHLSQKAVLAVGAIAADQYVHWYYGWARAQMVGEILAIAITYGIDLPYSRSHEREADRLGLRYMAKAGYDPRAALSFWEKMAVIEHRSGKQSDFTSTHPSGAERQQNLREQMDEALSLYADPLPP